MFRRMISIKDGALLLCREMDGTPVGKTIHNLYGGIDVGYSDPVMVHYMDIITLANVPLWGCRPPSSAIRLIEKDRIRFTVSGFRGRRHTYEDVMLRKSDLKKILRRLHEINNRDGFTLCVNGMEDAVYIRNDIQRLAKEIAIKYLRKIRDRMRNM